MEKEVQALSLHNMHHVDGARHVRKTVGRGTGSGHGKHLAVDIKVKTLVVAVAFVQDLKVYKLLYLNVYLNVDLQI